MNKEQILTNKHWQVGPYVTHSYDTAERCIRETHQTLAEAIQAAEIGWIVDIFIQNDLAMIWRHGKPSWINTEKLT